MQKNQKQKIVDLGEIIAIGDNELEIKDQTAYEELKRVESNPLLNEKQMITASDGIRYNLGQIHTQLQKKILHLPEDEQKKIMLWKQMHYELKAKRMNLTRKAYGQTITKSETGKVIAVKHPLDIRQEEIIDLFGKMLNVREIHEVCTMKFKMKHVTIDLLKQFRIKHASVIQEKIELFKKDYTDLRLAIKKGRLEELIYLFSKLKRKYDTNGKTDDHRALIATLEQIRKEAEGDSLRIDGNINIDLDGLLKNHIEQEIQATLPLREIILARIASVANIPIQKFLGQVEHSWYNKVFDEAETIPFEDVPRPTAQPYDFDRIAQQHKQKENNKLLGIPSPEDQETPFSAQEQEQGKSLKELLLARLKKQGGEVNYVKTSIMMSVE